MPKVTVSESYYAVEKVKGRRVKNGVVQYRVKWLGYPSSQNTWEPREHFNQAGHHEIVRFNMSRKQKA